MTEVAQLVRQSPERYYACKDPSRPLCKGYVKNGKCPKHDKCAFFHPKVITTVMKQTAARELGKCFCGAPLRTIIRNKPCQNLEFFVVCSSTSKSIHRCRN